MDILNSYAVALKSGEGYTIYAEEFQVPSEFSEKVLLIGKTKNLDFNGVIVNINPNLSYILVPSGDYEEDHGFGIFISTKPKQKYVVFRPTYVNPSPFGMSLGDHPNGANNPLKENGMRVMFCEEMTLHDRWWAWDKRGNTLTSNKQWTPGKNCLF